MADKRLQKNAALAGLPAEWPTQYMPEIEALVRNDRRALVTIDDDPTGTQTVHGMPVLTEWSTDSIRTELAALTPAFYLLSNSRSRPSAEAEALNMEIGRNLLAASRATGRDFVVVSRSDSTLRGHFPGEVEALSQSLGKAFDAWLIVPFFLEGGRYTVDNVHYVAEGEWLVPAAQTEFARDPVFGYQSSNLCQWVAERTGGRVAAEAVASISIGDIREGGPERVARRLAELSGGRVCVINAASYGDLEVFVRGLLAAEAHDKKFLYRTAASFVQVRAGLRSQPLLTASDLSLPASGGALIVVGSHVAKTSTQLEALLAQLAILGIELRVEALLDSQRHEDEILCVVGQARQALLDERDVAIYTSRQLATAATEKQSLALGRRVSAGLAGVVQRLALRPRYLIAKGGITASDVATAGLGVRRAMVLGQIRPGVPVWRLGDESRYPGLPYIVFPGNVGDSTTLAGIVAELSAGAPAFSS